MFKNYLKVAFRNILKYKGFSFINVTGLAIGLACCLLILLFVQDELSYDKFNENASHIYRMAGSVKFGGRDMEVATAPAPMAAALVRDFPEVKDAVRFRQRGEFVVKYRENSFKERRVAYADGNLFDIFTIPLLKGNPKTALTSPNSIILSRKTAEKYFAAEDPLGKTLKIDNKDDYKVTGIFEEIPHNSHFHFDLIASLTTLDESREKIWLNMNFNTYLLLHPGADAKALEAKFPAMVVNYVGPQVKMFTGKSLDEFKKGGGKLEYYLQPLRDIHLKSDLSVEFEPNSDIKYLYIFSAIAFFILIIACINFMNLSTARASGRAREVGIRKTVGSLRQQLIKQFLSETMLLSVIALLIAVGLVEFILPYFNSISGKELALSGLLDGFSIALVVLFTLFTGLLAGSYPAFFISSFKPVKVLKGQLKSGVKSRLLRRALVVFQFAASIVLVIGTAVVYNQLHYIQNRKLGFDKEQVLVLSNTNLLEKQTESFKNEILNHAAVVNGTISGYLPIPSNRNASVVFPEGVFDLKHSTTMQNWLVDYDYLKTLGMKIFDGRDFSREFSTDESAAIINREAAKQFGWKNPVGKKLSSYTKSGANNPELKDYRVIGVVEDFHFDSLRTNIQPLVMYLGSGGSRISFRLKTGDLPRTIGFIENTWNKFLPGQPFESSFMDEGFDAHYRQERRLGKIFTGFAILAIFIGCLGLFGLASFTAEQKTKEIGIRKVLGASIANIIKMVSREFIILVAVSNIIAWPLAYYVMNKWLQNFAYKTGMGIGVFILSGLLALLIALLTVSYQAVKAALANPVEALKYE